MSDPDGTKCSRCGASLPADGSADLCPRCRLSDARGAWSEDRSDSPSSPGEAHHEPSLDSLIAAIGATGQQPADADAHHYILAAATMALREQEAGRALSDADIHYYRGIALAAQKMLEQAVGEFAALIRLKPDIAVAHTTLGIALKAQRKPDEAVAEFRRAIRFQPDEPGAHYSLGIMLKAQGKLAEAIDAFCEALDHTQPGSDLALLIERALAESDHLADGRDRQIFGEPCIRSERCPTPRAAWREEQTDAQCGLALIPTSDLSGPAPRLAGPNAGIDQPSRDEPRHGP